jgi:hypothetical protein
MAPETDTSTTETLGDAPSFASPIAPEETDRDEDRLLLLWGRFWGEQTGPHAALFLRYNISQTELEHIAVRIHDRPDALTSYDPDQSGPEFLRHLLDQSENPNREDNRASRIRQAARQSLEEPEDFETIIDALETKNRDRFKEWARGFVRRIYTTDPCTFQIKGRLLSESLFDGPEPESDTQAGKNGSDPSTNGSKEQSKGNQKTVNVEFVNSPVNGKNPMRLSQGEIIYARIVGEVVEKLPDVMVDDERSHTTVPLPCQLEEREQNGDSVTLRASMDDNIVAEGIVPSNTRVKTKQDAETTSTSNLVAELILGLILAGALAVFFLQF